MSRIAIDRPAVRTKSFRRNLLALTILSSAVGVLYAHFEPEPVGTDPGSNHLQTLKELDKMQTNVAYHQAGDKLNGTGEIPDRVAHLMSQMFLERSYERLSKIPDYSATFTKRELVGGTLGDSQLMRLKVRHQPFSVYMKWAVGDKGREVIYVEGENDGDIVVHPGGWQGQMVPPVRLNPTGSMALSESRHPITKIGLLNLTKELMDHRRQEYEDGIDVSCKMIPHQQHGERPCYCFIYEFPSQELSKEYRKTVLFIDEEFLMPVCVRNFTWPTAEQHDLDPAKLDQETLIEFYSYTDIKLETQLANVDFSTTNGSYNFRQ